MQSVKKSILHIEELKICHASGSSALRAAISSGVIARGTPPFARAFSRLQSGLTSSDNQLYKTSDAGHTQHEMLER